MKLISFSVSNFRSITTAHRIKIHDKTVLVGKNNEGKSNLLKAMNIAMNILLSHSKKAKRYSYIRRVRFGDENKYFWERDYPILSQEGAGEKKTTFRLEFELSDIEIADFKKNIKSSINGSLPLEIKIGRNHDAQIKVAKKGRGGTSLTTKSRIISEFIADRISLNYIPAIRTDKESINVIRRMLENELLHLEENTDYQDALKTISDLQKPILEELANRIQNPLIEFLPSINSVKIEIPEEERRIALRRDFNVIIDDGTPTNIEFKGDGVKSLAAIGLLKDQESHEGASVILMEEPESHLHPSAIHRLNDVVEQLAIKNQVIISTHNPLFVERKYINRNIIIDGGTAKASKNIEQIRNLLGIKASDNLINANFVLVTEGEDDQIALTSLLSYLSIKINKALKQKLLVVDYVGGAGNVSYKLVNLKNSLCKYHVVLDNDNAGRKSFEKANNDNLLEIKNTTLISCQGMNDSEFEDCLDINIYRELFSNDYGVSLEHPEFKKNYKWSDRIKAVFKGQGKPWTEKIEKEIKAKVARCVSKNPQGSLNEHKRASIDSLVLAIEDMITI